MIANKLRVLRDRLLGTLWFVPSLVVAGFLVLAVGMVELSSHVDREALARWPLIFGANAESSRSILAAVAGGMITVAGLTFSLTLLAVTQASSQYTPRILRNFLGDRANQLMLGTFVGIFAYCLVVLRTIRGGESGGFVPSLAVVLGMVLGIVGLGVLIIAVHHIASSLQATSIIARVTAETTASIDRLFPDTLDEGAIATLAADHTLAESLVSSSDWHAVRANRSGYVQSTDIDALLRLATERDCLIRVDYCVGDFVTEERALARVAFAGGSLVASMDNASTAVMRKEVDAAFTIGRYRTVEQDPRFGIRQLVDISLKALSPGVNDTTTAVSCVHYLGVILMRVARRAVERPTARHDGQVRVLPCGPTFDEMVSLAFDEIRQSADGNVIMLRLLMETATIVGLAVSTDARRAALRRQLSLLHENASRTVEAPYDRRALRRYYRASAAAFDERR